MSKFEKGHPKVGGRKKGSPNRRTSRHREIISEFLDEVASKEEMVALFKTLDSGQKAQFLTKMFAFVTPKIEAHEISQEMTPADAREILNKILEERSNNDTD